MPDRDRIVSRYVRQYNEKKQSRKRRRLVMLPLKLVFGTAFVLVFAYFVVQIFLALNAPMTTATALATTVEDAFSVVGYFARNEVVLEEDYQGILLYLAGEGDKVGRNDNYAAVYDDTQAATLKATVQQLDEQISFLQSALASNLDANSVKNLSAQIYEGLYTTAQYTDQGVYTKTEEYLTKLKSNVITRELTNTAAVQIEGMIATLEQRRDYFNQLIGQSEAMLKSSVAGFFSSHVDGYETVFDIKNLDDLTPSAFDRLVKQGERVNARQVGRMVTGFTWYFVANIREENAASLRENARMDMRFDLMGDELVKVKIESISAPENGEVTVVFSSDKYMKELVNLRKQSASIILNTFEGLKVPKDAVRVDKDGNLGVYVITGMYSEFKKIDVLYETEEYYIVDTDPTTTKSLLVFDFIIVNGKGLSNGKVIK